MALERWKGASARGRTAEAGVSEVAEAMGAIPRHGEFEVALQLVVGDVGIGVQVVGVQGLVGTGVAGLPEPEEGRTPYCGFGHNLWTIEQLVPVTNL